MDHSFSAILGAIIFSIFVFGLAMSINSIPFYFIVVTVIGLMVFETVQEVRGWLKSRAPRK